MSHLVLPPECIFLFFGQIFRLIQTSHQKNRLSKMPSQRGFQTSQLNRDILQLFNTMMVYSLLYQKTHLYLEHVAATFQFLSFMKIQTSSWNVKNRCHSVKRVI